MKKISAKKIEYLPFNCTEGIALTPVAFPTRQAARDYVEAYIEDVSSCPSCWETVNGDRIPVDERIIRIIEVERIK